MSKKKTSQHFFLRNKSSAERTEGEQPISPVEDADDDLF